MLCWLKVLESGGISSAHDISLRIALVHGFIEHSHEGCGTVNASVAGHLALIEETRARSWIAEVKFAIRTT